MYIPGFNPYLENEFNPGRFAPMGVLPQAAQPFQQVRAPASATDRLFRTIPVPANELRPPAPAPGNPRTGGFGETFDETDLQYLAIGPEDDPFFVGTRGDTIGRDPLTNRGNPAGFVPFTPDSQYQLVNNATGQVVSAGAGEQGFRNAVAQAQALSSDGGKKANWSITVAGPDGQIRQVSADTPDKGALGTIADIALPLAGALLVPGLGLVGSKILAAGLGSAAGSTVSSAAQGRPLGDTLLRAGLSGLGAAGGATLGKAAGAALSKGAAPVSSTVGDVATQVATQKLAQTGAQVFPNIIVPGSLGALTGSKIGAVAGGALSNVADLARLGNVSLEDAITQQPAAPQQPQGALPSDDSVINVTGRAGVANPFGTALPIPMLQSVAEVAQAAQQTPQQDESEIIVSGSRAGLPVASDLGALAGLGTIPAAAAVASAPSDGLGDAAPEKNKTIGDRLKDLSVSDYLRIAGLGLGVLGGAGGGQGNRGVIPAGLGSGFNPVFSGGLPTPTLPGASTGFAPRDPANIDYYRYGYGPEQSFFSYVPQGQPNTSRAFTGYEQAQAQEEQGFYLGGMAGGGLSEAVGDDSFAVNGPGTGRSDEIPAMLSDGEYVIDAETVALLGDGSSKAGADLLDQFRVNVRKDKGRKLARGEFSADAKRPEQYLKGGRA